MEQKHNGNKSSQHEREAFFKECTDVVVKPDYLKDMNFVPHEIKDCVTTHDKERELRIAGMKIFATIMLNAWRKRRNDVQRLQGKINDMRKSSLKIQNQIHVYNTLFRVEQKRNDDLTCRLKRSMESIYQAKASCENINEAIAALRSNNSLLEQNLQNKNKEFDAINDILNQTKAELYQSMVEQRGLHTALGKEQRTVNALEQQKNKLINELCQLSAENRRLEEKYTKEIKKKDIELQRCQKRQKFLENDLNQYADKAYNAQITQRNIDRMQDELAELQAKLNSLQTTYDASLDTRLRFYWDKACDYNAKTVSWAQNILWWLLPAIPRPKPTLPQLEYNEHEDTTMQVD